MGGACGAYGGGESCARVLVRKPEGKKPLRRPRRRWEDNIKMDLREVGGGGDWMWSWLRIGTDGGTCEYGGEHPGSIKCGDFLTSCRTT